MGMLFPKASTKLFWPPGKEFGNSTAVSGPIAGKINGLIGQDTVSGIEY